MFLTIQYWTVRGFYYWVNRRFLLSRSKVGLFEKVIMIIMVMHQLKSTIQWNLRDGTLHDSTSPSQIVFRI